MRRTLALLTLPLLAGCVAPSDDTARAARAGMADALVDDFAVICAELDGRAVEAAALQRRFAPAGESGRVPGPTWARSTAVGPVRARWRPDVGVCEVFGEGIAAAEVRRAYARFMLAQRIVSVQQPTAPDGPTLVLIRTARDEPHVLSDSATVENGVSVAFFSRRLLTAPTTPAAR
ncbi:MAG: hypothetical protein K2X11_18265 [Acetobacteraceae bacterium]|nr:hypothetical protein [Acetobacteraceae bacterium]